jgi:hypothetical protein
MFLRHYKSSCTMLPSATKDIPESLPAEIVDNEHLARAVYSPYHIKSNGKIRPAAFKAASGQNGVSVNRLLALDFCACKKCATLIRSNGDFKGFAVLTASTVRMQGSDVIDSREYYWGHADIIHKIILEKGQPAPPEFNLCLKELAQAARFFPDPNPTFDTWTGDSL